MKTIIAQEKRDAEARRDVKRAIRARFPELADIILKLDLLELKTLAKSLGVL